MSKISRKATCARLFSERAALLLCPICHQSMGVREMNRLVCSNHHSFDISRHGYVNLLRRGPRMQYHRDLFQARRQMMTAGLFRPLSAALFEIIESAKRPAADQIRVLDAGCGEGSLLASVCGRLRNALGAGVDIAKTGVVMAAQTFPDQLWAVGDIANLPFADNQFDVVLNILSPSNYEEMRRVLHQNGLLVKVVPGENYLRELRNLLFSGSNRAVYSNQAVMDLFSQNVQQMNVVNLQYVYPLEPEMTACLVNMTPLSWGRREQTAPRDLQNLHECTIDLAVLTGKPIG